jgi:enoyl-CoA hydratase/carnithine racemase
MTKIKTTAKSQYAEGALVLEIEGAIATLILNRPEARNALNLDMWRALPQVIATIDADKSVRALIIQGAGGHFASGADISEFGAVFADHASALAYGGLIEAATNAIAASPKPVIASIDGYCIGAGLAVALACDLRIGSQYARLGAPPAKLGLIYSLTDTRRLAQAIGPSAAKDMLFTAALLPASEALRLGLLDAVAPPEGVAAAARAKAETLCALSSHSIQRTKAILSLILQGQQTDTDETRGWFADAPMGPDFAEGLAAHLERRAPKFPDPT